MDPHIAFSRATFKREAISRSINSWVQDRSIVISGSTGWFGRELLSIIDAERVPVIFAQSSQETREIRFGKLVAVHPPGTLPVEADIYVDFAFNTRDKLERAQGTKSFEQENSNILLGVEKILTERRFAKYVGVSSGAVFGGTNDLYAMQKRNFEELYLSHRSAPDSVARVWSVSGAECKKSDVFAFANLVEQALTSELIHVNSASTVLRRYCAIEEILFILLSPSAPSMFDSGGDMIEILELANSIRDILNPAAEVTRSEGPGVESRYFSDSRQFEDEMIALGAEPMTIPEQIANSVRVRLI